VLFISHGLRPEVGLEPDSAMEFCLRLTERERAAGRLPGGWEYTLPTSAQWEYACRAGTKTVYSFGDDVNRLSEFAWWGSVCAWWEGGVVKVGSARNEPYAHLVGTKKPNPWNLYDMHGNLWEWCLDDYVYKLPDGRDSPKGPRVVRGGGWYDTQGACRSAYRSGESPSDRGWHIGFRLVLSRSEQQPDAEANGPAYPDRTKTAAPMPHR